MSAHLDRLDAARLALLAAEPRLCAAEVAAFEALCAGDPLAEAEVDLCRTRLRTLAALAEACGEGVAAACRGLQDALNAAGRLTTYDASGARASRETRSSPGRRY